MGAEYSVEEIPADLLETATKARHDLIEAVADSDDVIMNLYLEGEEPTEAQLKTGIRKATIAMNIFPVLCGSSFKNKGVQTLLDAVVD
jgi:elongation factor G